MIVSTEKLQISKAFRIFMHVDQILPDLRQ